MMKLGQSEAQYCRKYREYYEKKYRNTLDNLVFFSSDNGSERVIGCLHYHRENQKCDLDNEKCYFKVNQNKENK